MLSKQLWRMAYGAGIFFLAWCAANVVKVFAEPKPITIRVQQKEYFAPVRIVLDVHVIPTDEDRVIWLRSDPWTTSSEIPLDKGAQSQRVYHWPWIIREPGIYEFTALVGHEPGVVRAVAKTLFQIP